MLGTNLYSEARPDRQYRSPRERGQDPLQAIESMAALSSWRRSEAIDARVDPHEHWYRLVAGAARACALRADGRRQILDFLLPGDFFGFATPDGHDVTVEAVVEDTRVARYPRKHLEMLADFDPQLGRRLRDVAFEAIARLQTRMLILGRMTAIEKVGSFLVEMVERSADGAGGAVVLPMSRYDIADYLGLSAETVSRCMTDLKHRGAIVLRGTHQVSIVNRRALEDWHDAGGPS